ncbi:MAG: tol-pal system-associated acyl-CoA thioesterase [Micavibrio aeruginosavorus]|uniref:Tol-pal system-associated acyl-CoA thioesterase n=1 Tax=Micavibrio aeruginosavorus TaxID=349221 RepID=A0A2W5HBU9_9BACT|nr:MAG: tol-pal system-associated acyl-CoA thioesterase [Micavibrio aeruginosavorus]
MAHDIQCRVYYEDTDAGGVMYHANHIKFCERGRTEFLRSFELQNSDLHAENGVLFVVRHLEADYFKPARLDDLLTVKTSLKSIKNTSFMMRQEIFKGEEVLFGMDVLLVTVNTQGKPTALPDNIKNLFKESLEQST